MPATPQNIPAASLTTPAHYAINEIAPVTAQPAAGSQFPQNEKYLHHRRFDGPGSFGITLEEAQQGLDKMVDAVKGWRELFVKHKVEERSVEYISGAILPECFFREEPHSAE